MNKFEAIAKVFESENGPVIAGISAIVILVGGYYLTKGNYRIEAKNDKKSFTLEPAAAKADAPRDETEEQAAE